MGWRGEELQSHTWELHQFGPLVLTITHATLQNMVDSTRTSSKRKRIQRAGCSHSRLLNLPSALLLCVTNFLWVKEYLVLYRSVCYTLTQSLQPFKRPQRVEFAHIITRFDVDQNKEALKIKERGLRVTKLIIQGSARRTAHELGLYNEEKIFDPARHFGLFFILHSPTELHLNQVSVRFFRYVLCYIGTGFRIEHLKWEATSADPRDEEIPSLSYLIWAGPRLERLRTIQMRGHVEHVTQILEHIRHLSDCVETISLSLFGAVGKKCSPDTWDTLPQLVMHYFPNLTSPPAIRSRLRCDAPLRYQQPWPPNPHLDGTCSCKPVKVKVK